VNTLSVLNLSLFKFKNYNDFYLEFTSGANCFVGPNGVGKTTVLDAIHYLSLCKSYFNPIDSQNIKHNEQFFIIQSQISRNNETNNFVVSVKKGQKKIIKCNQKEYEKLSDHIGLFPLVMISPTDSYLITEGSEERRRFIDSIISQYDKIYLEKLILYNKVLAQRNALLKNFFEQKLFDIETLEVWNQQLIPYGKYIFEKRTDFLNKFLPIFNHYYQFISTNNEEVSITYESQLNNERFEDLLFTNTQRDKAAQYTTTGIHKDDLTFTIQEYPLRKFGSQGQQKTFLLALKLAQFDFLKEKTRTIPLLLLDDIYEKLDENRVTRLMELVSNNHFGQIFITDTHKDRIENVFSKINIPLNTIEINKVL
jgi:DNA replication and repair protein RecF